ncbi:MAG: C-type lectin domain-containing protein [Kofleriaceae bacterium]
MRWILVAVVASGCGFSAHAVTNAGDDDGDATAPADAPSDAAIDSAPVAPAACLADPSFQPISASAHTYKLTPASDFDTAFDACSTAGAHLVVIHDPAENALVRTANGDGWIGLDDLITEGGFHWADASPVDYTNWNQGTHEPNDANGNEDCAYAHADDGSWNDTACDNSRKGLCECEPGYRAPAVPACRTMAGAKLENGRRYFVRTTAASWDVARGDCAAIGAYLIAPSDDTENQLVEHADKLDLGADGWIGLSQDVQLPTQWDWLDHAPYTYSNWITGGAHTGPGQACVVVHASDDKWENLSCDSQHPYVCECDPGEP